MRTTMISERVGCALAGSAEWNQQLTDTARNFIPSNPLVCPNAAVKPAVAAATPAPPTIMLAPSGGLDYLPGGSAAGGRTAEKACPARGCATPRDGGATRMKPSPSRRALTGGP